jgi:hypothetical protein
VPSGGSINDNQIFHMLNSEIVQGHLGMPTANRLYVVFTTPNVTVTKTATLSSA